MDVVHLTNNEVRGDGRGGERLRRQQATRAAAAEAVAAAIEFGLPRVNGRISRGRTGGNVEAISSCLMGVDGLRHLRCGGRGTPD